MTRYLVKTVSTGTESNPNFSGHVHTHIYGKEDMLIYADGDPWIKRDNLNAWYVRDNGYKRECDARRNFSFTHPENSEYWRTAVEILKFEIWSDETGKLYMKAC
jgi:hypothetical protein